MQTITRDERIVFLLNVQTEEEARAWIEDTEVWYSDAIVERYIPANCEQFIVWVKTDRWSLRHATFNERLLDKSDALIWWHRRPISE